MRNLIVKKPVVIVGMMGSGKSTIGKRLAHKLNLQFYDSDKTIEERENLSVVDIFYYKGEEYFRQEEANIIKEILGYGSVILSTGGGSFLIEEVREMVKKKATSIWLKTDLSTIHKRVSRRNTRPGLDTADDKLEVLQKIAEEALPIYQEADIVIDCDNMETFHVVDAIINKLKIHANF
jgi:shikimate kinase